MEFGQEKKIVLQSTNKESLKNRSENEKGLERKYNQGEVEKGGHDIELNKTRQEIQSLINQSTEQEITSSQSIEKVKALKTLNDFSISKEKYGQFLIKRGININQIDMRLERSWTHKMTVNLIRMVEDIKRKKRIIEKTKSGEINLKSVNLSIEIMDRDALIDDSSLVDLWSIEENIQTLLNFTKKELYQEIGATRWLKLTGVNTEQLHTIIEEMGHNPATFISDDRGEKDGRISINNYLSDFPFDKDDPAFLNEMKYWQPLYTNKFLPEFVRKWQTSRIHSVIFRLIDKDKNDIFLLPIHVDPKNFVVTIKEIFEPSKKGERPAIRYHDISKEGTDQYHGVGLYNLGIFLFLNMLKSKQGEIFGNLSISGEDKLDTTKTIFGDNQNGIILENVFLENYSLQRNKEAVKE